MFIASLEARLMELERRREMKWLPARDGFPQTTLPSVRRENPAIVARTFADEETSR